VVACDSSDPENISATARSFRVTHSGSEFSVAIGTTDISDTGAIATSGGVRNINIENIHLPDSIDLKNIDPKLADKKIVTDATQKLNKAPIGTTDISDTGAVRKDVIVKSADTSIIGATDISDMGGILVLSDNTILAFTFNADGRALMESIDMMPSAAVKQTCYALTSNILVKNGELIVKRSDGSVVSYNATTNIVILRKEGDELCIYLKPKS
jgi:hypothetical protein